LGYGNTLVSTWAEVAAIATDALGTPQVAPQPALAASRDALAVVSGDLALQPPHESAQSIELTIDR
jgi:hypothetical protein